MDKYGIIYCPRHKWFFHYDTWSKTRTLLSAEGIDYELVCSDGRNSVTRIVKQLVGKGCQTIVVMGGDTALRSAAQALMELDETVRRDIALGLLPNGVENDFARFWRMETDDMTSLVKALHRRRLRKIDVGHISYTDRRGMLQRCYFLGSVNIGLIARQMNMLHRWRRLIGSRMMSYVATFLLMIFQRMEYAMHIMINQSDVNRKFMSASIGNTMCYGLTPSASPYDGMLDVSLIHHPRFRQLIEGYFMLKKKKVINLRSVTPYRTTSIVFKETPRCDIVVDGTPFNPPAGGFSINVEAEQINFIIPL